MTKAQIQERLCQLERTFNELSSMNDTAGLKQHACWQQGYLIGKAEAYRVAANMVRILATEERVKDSNWISSSLSALWAANCSTVSGW